MKNRYMKTEFGLMGVQVVVKDIKGLPLFSPVWESMFQWEISKKVTVPGKKEYDRVMISQPKKRGGIFVNTL